MPLSPPLFAFPHSSRIVTGAEYSAVRRRGRRLETKHFVVYVAEASHGGSRVGVVASRKVGKAVVRTRAKRLVREVFRLNRPYLQAGVDVVVIVKPGADDPGFGQYEADFQQALGRYFGRLSGG